MVPPEQASGPLNVRGTADGVLVAVRVRPRSSPGVEVGEHGLAIRVRSAPEGGRATEEARRALARALGVPAYTVVLQRGALSREKVFLVGRLSVDKAVARLRQAAR
jgi:uncharacterized protein YggU (UPF0235/DUF167 family)